MTFDTRENGLVIFDQVIYGIYRVELLLQMWVSYSDHTESHDVT